MEYLWRKPPFTGAEIASRPTWVELRGAARYEPRISRPCGRRIDRGSRSFVNECSRSSMIWRAYGCASFVEYMQREMGYTERAAIERLRVAKAIEEVPQLGVAMNQGARGRYSRDCVRPRGR
jgi:hypothetical protein